MLWVQKCEYGVLEITHDTKVFSSHSWLLYHLWFPKPHTHISYSQHLHNVECAIYSILISNSAQARGVSKVSVWCCENHLLWLLNDVFIMTIFCIVHTDLFSPFSGQYVIVCLFLIFVFNENVSVWNWHSWNITKFQLI